MENIEKIKSVLSKLGLQEPEIDIKESGSGKIDGSIVSKAGDARNPISR